jgi:hypothetical protein
MSEVERPPVSAAQAARELATTLLDQADALDLHDLRATGAIEQVRVKSRALADAVHDRGWGELYLGIDSLYLDDEDDGELDDLEDLDDVEPADDEWPEGDEDVFDTDLPADALRLSYQARFDFVVTDPEALVAYVRKRAGEAGNDEVLEEIQDPVAAFQLLTFLDGIGSKEYDAVGLSPAGGEESQQVVKYALWDLDPTRRDDTYPY